MSRNGFKVSVLFVTLLLAGCAVGGTSSSTGLDEPNPATTRTEVPTEVDTGRFFVERAREHFRENNLGAAEDVINRGFNVAPGNPVLWHLLAKIRFLEKKYGESETFATRSNNYADEGAELVAQNWRLIAHARKASGDEEGARRALERVEGTESDQGWLPSSWF